MMKNKQLTAPFIYTGGKRRWASEVWSRLGKVEVYSEPFAGSLAVLLANPHPAQREVVSDIDGHICNFWRAMAVDPAAVAYWADWPTTNQDLIARHRWLMQWIKTSNERLMTDPEWYSAKAAGWWCWGLSNYYSSGWCLGNIPLTRPHMNSRGGGEGVSIQRINIPFREQLSENRLFPWFQELSYRLERVVTLNQDWANAVSKTVLQDIKSNPKKIVGIFMDPPYRTDTGRFRAAYKSDVEGKYPAEEAFEWAVEHGGRYRIAYACHEGDFDIPEGWSAVSKNFGKGRKESIDQVLFSPACLATEEGGQWF